MEDRGGGDWARSFYYCNSRLTLGDLLLRLFDSIVAAVLDIGKSPPAPLFTASDFAPRCSLRRRPAPFD